MWQRGAGELRITFNSRSRINLWQLMISNKIKAKICAAYPVRYLISNRNEAIGQQLSLTN